MAREARREADDTKNKKVKKRKTPMRIVGKKPAYAVAVAKKTKKEKTIKRHPSKLNRVKV